jgi:hypothetical protein
MSAINPKHLPLGRIAVGASTFVAPELIGSLLGFKPSEDQAGAYMARLFGVRDLALGVGTLASSGEAQALWWRLGIVCDLADAANGYLSMQRGAPKRGAIATVALALGAVGLGILGTRSSAAAQ